MIALVTLGSAILMGIIWLTAEAITIHKEYEEIMKELERLSRGER